MEVLGAASAIAGLISLAIELTKLSYEYGAGVKSSREAWNSYVEELLTLTLTLQRVKKASEAPGVGHLLVDGVSGIQVSKLAECKTELEKLRDKLSKKLKKTGFKKSWDMIVWPFSEGETKEKVEMLRRFGLLFGVLLQADNYTVSVASYQELRDMRDEAEVNDFLRWIEPKVEHSRITVNDILAQRCPGTRVDFLAKSEYVSWRDEDKDPKKRALWAFGPPGSGKTVLSAIILENIENSHLERLISYFFFEHDRKDTLQDVLRTVIHQLLGKVRTPPPEALELYKRRLESKGALLLNDLIDILGKISQMSPGSFIILDGLDEFADRKKLLTLLPKVAESGVKILVTSRDLADIRAHFADFASLEVKAEGVDIQRYVDWRLEEDSEIYELFTEDLKQELTSKLEDYASGSFLLARLSIDCITGMTRIKEVRNAMKSLPTNHEDAYRNTYDRILSQTKKRRRLALEALNWVCNSKRSLKMLELQHAIAIGEDDLEEVGAEDIESSRLILSSCLGLIVLSQSGQTVEMLHSTAKDFVLANQETIEPNPNATISQVCLKYMSIPEMKKGHCTTLLDLRNRLATSPFLEYSTQYYGYHVVEAPECLPRLRKFLESDHLRQSAWQILHFVMDLDSESAAQSFERTPSQPSILHVAAYWGFLDVVNGVLAARPGQAALDKQDSHGWTPMHWAASNGNDEILTALVNAGGAVDALDLSQWTPLFWAVVKGHETSCCLLLGRNADAFHVDNNGLSPLHWSIISGWENITANLIEHVKTHERRGFESPKPSSNTVLAARELSVSAAKAILATQNKENPEEQKAKNLFRMASDISDYTDFGKLLVLYEDTYFTNQPGLQLGQFQFAAEKVITKRDRMGLWDKAMMRLPRLVYLRRKCLLGAIAEDDLAIVKGMLSLRHEVNLDLNDPINGDGDCYVHVAAAIARPEILLALIDNGANRTLSNKHGSTILHRACKTGSSKMVETILGFDDDEVDMVDDEGRTPLMLLLKRGAWRTDSCPQELISILSALIARGASIHAKDSAGNQVIHFAMKSWSSEAIQLLIDHGADVRAVNDHKQTPLHILASSTWEKSATRIHQLEKLKKAFLVPKQCIVDSIDLFAKASPPDAFVSLISAEDSNKCTALSVALQNENWPLAQRLHELGAKFQVTDEKALNRLLFTMATRGRALFVRLLLENGANAKRNQDIVPWVIEYATTTNYVGHNPATQEYLPVLRELLESGANIHENIPRSGKSEGMTSIQLAIDRGMEATFVSTLLHGGAGKTYSHAVFHPFYES